MIRVFVFLALLFVPPAALAAGGGEEKRPPSIPSVDLPAFMAPLTVKGELRFYMYVVIKMDLTSDFKKPVVLEKVPYLQDAIIRDVHANEIGSAANPEIVDEEALAARFKLVMDKVVGPDVIAKVNFRTMTRAAH